MDLTQRRVLMLAADDFEDMELLYPLYRLAEEGVAVTVMTNYGFHAAMAEHGVEVVLATTAPRHLRLDLLQKLLAQLGLALFAPQLRQLRDLGLVDVGALDALKTR